MLVPLLLAKSLMLLSSCNRQQLETFEKCYLVTNKSCHKAATQHHLNPTMCSQIVADQLHLFITVVDPFSNGCFQRDNVPSDALMCPQNISWNCLMLSSQHGPRSLWKVSSNQLSQCFKEFKVALEGNKLLSPLRETSNDILFFSCSEQTL